jgi:hypothetical protein
MDQATNIEEQGTVMLLFDHNRNLVAMLLFPPDLQ